MSEGIQPNNIELEKLIAEMVEISCNVIYNMYLTHRNIPAKSESCLLTVKYFMQEVVAFIINDLFTQNKKKLNILSFNDLNKRFTDYKYVFTPGYIRESVFVYYRDHLSEISAKIAAGVNEDTK